MRTLGPNARTILALFDEQLGGLAAPSSVVSLILSKRGVQIGEKNLLVTLNRLARQDELTKIPRPKGGAVYTRPRNLTTTSGLRARLEQLPDLDVRRGRATTDRRYDLRKKRALNDWANDGIRAGGHDFRYNFETQEWHSCLTCGRDPGGRLGPCKLRTAADEAARKSKLAAGARMSGSDSASRAK